MKALSFCLSQRWKRCNESASEVTTTNLAVNRLPSFPMRVIGARRGRRDPFLDDDMTFVMGHEDETSDEMQPQSQSGTRNGPPTHQIINILKL